MLREVPPPIANPENGEVLLQVKGPQGEVREAFVLRMNTNAVCRLEKAMGEHVHKLGPRLSNPGMQDLRALVFAALSEKHPLMSLEDAGNVIDRAGFDACVAAVMEAFTLGFPKAAKGAAAEKADPGKGHGTGNGSSVTPRRRGSGPNSSLR